MTWRFRIEPCFIDGPAGQLFCVHYVPDNQPARATVLFVPPFGDEMHKSRWMTATQARHFAAHGYRVMQLDLSGCGDSWGDFADSTWARWNADVHCAAHWLVAQDDPAVPLVIWGLRVGGLLATQVAASLACPVLLWQPVTDGEGFVTQLLRLRLATELLQNGQARSRVLQLRAELERKGSIEIGGYRLSATLVNDLARLKLAEVASPPRAAWIELKATETMPIPVASAAVMRHWRADGCMLETQTLVGEPFWMTQEIVFCPALVSRTGDALQGLVS
jgi:exosortase A-associated hydrolase 2